MPEPYVPNAALLAQAGHRPGAGYRLAAGGLASTRRAAKAVTSALDDAPAWEPILPNGLAGSTPVRLLTKLLCDPPHASTAMAWARATCVPQALGWTAAAAVLCTLGLYWGKSQAAMLDGEITRVVQASSAAHARSAVLKAQWAALNDPDRLRPMVERYLALHPLEPGQYAESAALSLRLPPVTKLAVPDEPDEPAVTPRSAAPQMIMADAKPLQAMPPSLAADAPPPEPAAAPPRMAESVPVSEEMAPQDHPPEEQTSQDQPLQEQSPQSKNLVADDAPSGIIETTQPTDKPATIGMVLAPAAKKPLLIISHPALVAAQRPLRPLWKTTPARPAPVVAAQLGVLRVAGRLPPGPVHHDPVARVMQVMAARPELPHWLTEPHDIGERHDLKHLPRAMSEPAHFLDVPKAVDPPPAPPAQVAAAPVEARSPLPVLRQIQRFAVSPPGWGYQPYGGYYPPPPNYAPYTPSQRWY